ncbi:MAG: molybdopterin adenylyltransferase [Candidatus Omnitrophota bacterium]
MASYQKIRLGILTISDRASQGTYEDISGKIIAQAMKNLIANPLNIYYRIVPDEKRFIVATLRELCDKQKCSLVVTTGGTGPAKRDVTPEATQKVCKKLLPGFGEAMRAASMRQTPTAILSRQNAGIREKTLIVNLPGSPKAITTCLNAIAGALGDCLRVLDGPNLFYRKKQLNINHHKRS